MHRKEHMHNVTLSYTVCTVRFLYLRQVREVRIS
uniref:Uncharacterized protein n=1 Tax=Arundo donax TaxID=35708 RepID=A0A0A8Y664_ARUDO